MKRSSKVHLKPEIVYNSILNFVTQTKMRDWMSKDRFPFAKPKMMQFFNKQASYPDLSLSIMKTWKEPIQANKIPTKDGEGYPPYKVNLKTPTP